MHSGQGRVVNVVKPTSRQACVSLQRKPYGRRAFIDSMTSGFALGAARARMGRREGAKDATIPSRGFWPLRLTSPVQSKSAQVMPGNQTCRIESANSPLGE